jgi:hypothetical protein
MTWSKLSSGFRLDSIAKGAPQAEIRDGDDEVASSANFGHAAALDPQGAGT